MPEILTELTFPIKPEYQGYFTRVSMVLAGYAAEGRFRRFYHGVVDTIGQAEEVCKAVISTYGNTCNFLAKRSCTAVNSDTHRVVSINIFYPLVSHTLTYIAPLQENETRVIFELEGLMSRLEVFKRELL